VQVFVLACVAGGAIYTLFLVGQAVQGLFAVAPAVEARAPPILPAGWDDLAGCAALASLDGAKELTFGEDRDVELVDLSPGAELARVKGAWAYDSASKRYLVTLNGEKTVYTLVARGDPTTCILFKGEFEAADLRASWFSFPVNDDPEH